MIIEQQSQLIVNAANPAWVDSGIVVNDGEGLRIIATGRVQFGSNPATDFAFAEGTYYDGDINHAYDPGSVKDYAFFGDSIFPVTNTAPASLAAIVRADGVIPTFDTIVNDALKPNRDTTFTNQAGRVWLTFNDTQYSDQNSGGFEVTVQRVLDIEPEIDFGQPSPIRGVPHDLLIRKQSASSCWAWCLAVKDALGQWEGWTYWDLGLDLPEYVDELGNVTPALTYRPAVSQLSNLALATRLQTNAADLTVLAPRNVDAGVMLDYFFKRDKIIKSLYAGGYWELFEIDPTFDLSQRILWNCGTIGNTGLDDLTAQPELTGYEDMANHTVGDVYHILCQVGERPGENFGNGRCRNQVLQNGPLRDDWTVAATVEIGSSQGGLVLSFGAVARSGEDLPAEFTSRLAAGDVEFWDAPDGGSNSNVSAMLAKGAELEAGKVLVTPRISLPYAPGVGDRVWLVAGCRRTKGACIEFGNLSNMRAQDLPEQTDLLRQYKQ